MNKQEKKKLCSGCRNNYYNMGKGFVGRDGIDAVVTVDECWNFKDSKIVTKKKISVSQYPPFNNEPQKTLDCWSSSNYIMIDKDRID